MIPEPHCSLILELWTSLVAAAGSFVLVGGQALKFLVPNARATKDFDFIVDALSIRGAGASVREALRALDYTVVPESRNFQFEKRVPNSRDVLRVELMAPHELKRKKDFRVEIEAGVHARACLGGGIVLAESDSHEIRGRLPSGESASATIRVTRPHALVFMKCLAMDERYRNLRGIEHFEHDRDSARTHVADIVAVLSACADLPRFGTGFRGQFAGEPELCARVRAIVDRYFANLDGPGVRLYQEHVRSALESESPWQLATEVARAHRLLAALRIP